MSEIIYKKYNFKNKEELTDTLFLQMHAIDKIDIDPVPKKSYVNFLKKGFTSESQLYLMFNKGELVGGLLGNFKSKESFFVDRFFIDINRARSGIGTKLLARVFADLRVNHKIKTIEMIPFDGTREINKKLTGKKKIKIIIDGKIKEVTRKFNSNFRYDLAQKKSKKHQPKDIIKIKRK
jgi:hypothetical protein